MSRATASPPAKAGLTPPSPLEGNLIVFDGICLFCSGFARFMAQRDKTARFSFVNAHSQTGRALYLRHGLDPDLLETNIVVYEGQAYTGMASFTAAMSSLGWPWKAFMVLDFLPHGFADKLYDRIARNRYRLGRRTCPLPSKDLKDRLVD
ncbi:DUF393 domain-containing protein [Labrenzia sp. OB1]|uniref:thiol-disulfide oxidoreductase DCC family protein n=1 Tax=Labrenzia sp. OB1 TaxID=1561204 RepID=UPI0007B30E3E|nr:DUF393 domain-containing protein [Labrenzia sp. OB1]KZM48141.1 thiol-disulfide oxidoreductase [Labrenzia sp. OB1]